jgi:hypothetical protein
MRDQSYQKNHTDNQPFTMQNHRYHATSNIFSKKTYMSLHERMNNATKIKSERLRYLVQHITCKFACKAIVWYTPKDIESKVVVLYILQRSSEDVDTFENFSRYYSALNKIGNEVSLWFTRFKRLNVPQEDHFLFIRWKLSMVMLLW